MTVSPDPSLKADRDLRAIGENLLRISKTLHEHARKLEVVVEGQYANEGGDPRVGLLRDSLRISRIADLELGRLNQSAQRVLLTLQQQLDQSRGASPGKTFDGNRAILADTPTTPLMVPPHPVTTSSASPGSPTRNFEREREELTTSILNLKRQRNELETLYEIARALNSTLELDKVLRLVMDEVIHVVNAERGFLMLVNPATNELEFTIARDKQRRTIEETEFKKMSYSTVKRVVRTREPVIADDAHVDNTLKAQESIMVYGIRSIMCVPLVVRDTCIGAVYVDSRINANLFGPQHRDLLVAFCHQAAIAIDNARLFVRVNEDKQYMDNIFTSMANGVVTTDSTGIITKFNKAAGFILQLDAASALGKHYREVFHPLPQVGLIELLQNAMKQHDQSTIVPFAIDCDIPGRGRVNLNLYISSLRDAQDSHIGMALVVDDRTELKRSEARIKEIRSIFGRFVHPNVVQRLIDDPTALKLGGETKEITVISADIRGFTHLSERKTPQEVMHLLNAYLEIMVKEIWDEGGTITGFWGDELMAIFNAPLRQEDHVMRAVRAAWKMRLAVQAFQRSQPQDLPFSFGFGVNTGEAMVGNIGSTERMQSYTAIGDVVNVASRLQSNASDNNILLNHSTFIRVRQHVHVIKLPPLQVKNKTEPLDVWCLTGWDEAS